MSEWHRVVSEGAIFIALMELFEIGKWVFTDGWGGVFKFHLRPDRQFLAHCIGLLYGGAIFGILSVFGWRGFRGAPLIALVIIAGVGPWRGSYLARVLSRKKNVNVSGRG